MRVLTVNAGSSTLKLSVLDADDTVLGTRETPVGSDIAGQVRALLDETGAVAAVGHRVVHGGAAHVRPERVTGALVADLARLVPLAPLHQPAALTGISAARAALPRVPSVACFDTAFHAGLPAAAATYALPREWRERYGLRRYGMHGLSHAYAARRAGEMAARSRRTVVAHLGAGGSLAAVLDGRSVDTTMGFTPMEGLVMATRAGTVDPGLLLWLVTDAGLTAEQVTDGVDRRGGLLALAGTKDMREVVDRSAGGDREAALGLEVYVHRLAASVAAMTVALGGLDVLVFTGGIGQRSAAVRARTVDRLAHLGVVVDPARNDAAEPDADVSSPEARVATLVVAAREDLEIARGARQLLG